jgi:hypothetical protein
MSELFSDSTATWRQDPATDRQKAKLLFFGCEFKGAITKGEASDAITYCVENFPAKEEEYQSLKYAMDTDSAAPPPIPSQLTQLRLNQNFHVKMEECVCSCGQPLEYALNDAGKAVACPGCQMTVTLPESAENQGKGFFKRMVGKVEAISELAKRKQSFEADLVRVAAFDAFDEGNYLNLIALRSSLGLDTEDLSKIAAKAFAKSVEVVLKDGVVTPEETLKLNAIQQFLGLPDSEIQQYREEISHGITLYNISQGIFPRFEVENLIVKDGERVLWVEKASLYEDKVVSRRYEGGSSGVSFRLAKGVSFRVGNHRGHMVTERDEVETGRGVLVITNKRVVFHGGPKGISIPLAKIVSIDPYETMLYIDENNKAKKGFRFDRKAGPFICGALTYAVRLL